MPWNSGPAFPSSPASSSSKQSCKRFMAYLPLDFSVTEINEIKPRDGMNSRDKAKAPIILNRAIKIIHPVIDPDFDGKFRCRS